MYCTKCGSNLVNGVCPFCLTDEDLLDKQETISNKQNSITPAIRYVTQAEKTRRTITLILTILAVTLSVSPFHYIGAIIGGAVAITTIVLASVWFKEYKSWQFTLFIYLSIAAVIILSIWLYFLLEVAHKI